jgi:predicted transcriptional regulator
VKEKKRRNISAKLTDTEFECLKKIAEREDRTRSCIIAHLILEEYDRLFQGIDGGKH